MWLLSQKNTMKRALRQAVSLQKFKEQAESRDEYIKRSKPFFRPLSCLLYLEVMSEIRLICFFPSNYIGISLKWFSFYIILVATLTTLFAQCGLCVGRVLVVVARVHREHFQPCVLVRISISNCAFSSPFKYGNVSYLNFKAFSLRVSLFDLALASFPQSLDDDTFHRPVLNDCECTFSILK